MPELSSLLSLKVPFLKLSNATLCAWLKNLVPLYQPISSKSKPIVTYSHTFSRAWRRLHVFDSSSDWFIGLSASVVIGHSNYFGFGFTTL